MILIIDTADKEATIAIKNDKRVFELRWEAGRELGATFFDKLDEIFNDSNATFDNLNALIVNTGPGSFTGFRIGISIANTIAYALNLPIVGISSPKNFEFLISEGEKLLNNSSVFSAPVVPFYGSEPHITKPKNHP